MKIAAIALLLVACGPQTPSPGEAPSQLEAQAACDPGVSTIELVEAKLTPYELDKYADCDAPDDPTLYGRVWCCPAKH